MRPLTLHEYTMKKTIIRTVEDLLADETFIAWYHQSDANAVRDWNEWISAGSFNRELADEAKRLLTHLLVKEKNIQVQQVNTATARLLLSIKEQSK